MNAKTESNPLLADPEGPIDRILPHFEAVTADHVVPGISHLLQELERDLDALEAGAQPSWAELVEPLERLGDRLSFSWGIVGHLLAVRNSDDLRAAYEEMQPRVVAFYLRLGQSHALYETMLSWRQGNSWAALDPAQQRILESMLRDARQAGVGLEGEARDRFNAIEAELAELSTRFSNHVLDATKAFSLTLTKRDEVAGLPPSALALAAQSAEQAGESGATPDEGPWRITLDIPSFFPFLEHGRRRDLREKLYRAYVQRASEGEFDNTDVIGRILALRSEQASLLGFESYAELSLDSKMAPDVEAVEALLEQLRRASYPAAERDLAELRAFARSQGETEELWHWDLPFWVERLREDRFSYSEEDLRPYFPLSHVLEGLFALAEHLFGVEIVAAEGAAPVWHEDVRFFRVRDDSGEDIAAFYLDPYSRPAEKRGGAWMDVCVGRRRLAGGAGLRLPVAVLVCNQTPPIGTKPSCMTFDEVTTLFHEFGHGLQHMLTRVDYGLAAGIRNVEWDAVELPSQFMENWCYEAEWLRRISSHVETGESLPDDLIEKLRSARTFRAGSDSLRQLYFAFTDLRLHAGADPGAGPTAFELQREVAQQTTVLAPLDEDRTLCSFGHIFAGGYAAGYYSYKWAEVLSADAFAAFEEAGLQDQAAVQETGRRYRETILALGGSQAPMQVFEAFRGRPPSPEALLRHAGLEAA